MAAHAAAGGPPLSPAMATVTVMKSMIGAGVLALPYSCGLVGLGLGDHAVIVDPVALDLGVLGRQGAAVECDGNRCKTKPSSQSGRPQKGADLDAGGDREITDLSVTAVIDLPVRKPALSRSPNSFFNS